MQIKWIPNRLPTIYKYISPGGWSLRFPYQAILQVLAVDDVGQWFVASVECSANPDGPSEEVKVHMLK